MRSLPTKNMYFAAERICDYMHMMSIINPWFPNAGGNIKKMTQEDVRASMMLVLAGIRYTAGELPSTLGGRYITQNEASWLAHGKRSFLKKRGNSIDCTAAVVNLMLQYINRSIYNGRIEILLIEDHAFVVVNRRGPLMCPEHWGEDTFVIDLWFSNQFPKYQTPAVFWADDHLHPIHSLIIRNAMRLSLAATINEGGLEHTIIPLVAMVA